MNNLKAKVNVNSTTDTWIKNYHGQIVEILSYITLIGDYQNVTCGVVRVGYKIITIPIHYLEIVEDKPEFELISKETVKKALSETELKMVIWNSGNTTPAGQFIDNIIEVLQNLGVVQKD